MISLKSGFFALLVKKPFTCIFQKTQKSRGHFTGYFLSLHDVQPTLIMTHTWAGGQWPPVRAQASDLPLDGVLAAPCVFLRITALLLDPPQSGPRTERSVRAVCLHPPVTPPSGQRTWNLQLGIEQPSFWKCSVGKCPSWMSLHKSAALVL